MSTRIHVAPGSGPLPGRWAGRDALDRVRAGLLRGALLAALVAGCAGAPTPSPAPSVLPEPTCGGIEIALPGALACDRIAAIAMRTLAERAPDQLARGVTRIDVALQPCPRGEVPPQVDCTGETHAQLVTVEFGPAPPGGPIEPSLTVAIGPVSGRVLGVANPLIR